MDDSFTTLQNSPFTCPWCKEPVSSRDENCLKCGYPLKGSEHDQERFRIQREIFLRAKYAKRQKVYGGIFILFVVMALCFICGIVGYFARDDYPVTWRPKSIVFLSGAVVLLPASIYSRKKPVLCFIIGAVVIIAGSIALYIIDSNEFDYRGLIIIITFLVVLVSGILAKQAEAEMDRDYNQK